MYLDLVRQVLSENTINTDRSDANKQIIDKET